MTRTQAPRGSGQVLARILGTSGRGPFREYVAVGAEEGCCHFRSSRTVVQGPGAFALGSGPLHRLVVAAASGSFFVAGLLFVGLGSLSTHTSRAHNERRRAQSWTLPAQAWSMWSFVPWLEATTPTETSTTSTTSITTSTTRTTATVTKTTTWTRGRNREWQRRASSGNPFKGRSFYVSPFYRANYNSNIADSESGEKENLARMREAPSAFWISSKATIRMNASDPESRYGSLEGVLQDAASKADSEMVVFVWYNLPNRDCSSAASSGEICCVRKMASYGGDGSCAYRAQVGCEEGLHDYMRQFVDPIIALLQEYEDRVPMAVVVEPDSLANLVTNSGHESCGDATREGYLRGIKYTVSQLTEKTSAAVYIDAAHGGWLGWNEHIVEFMKTIRAMDLPLHRVRGFSTNVAKYMPLGVMCPWKEDPESDLDYQNSYCLKERNQDDPCCIDPCHLLDEWSTATGELNYAQQLVRAAKGILGMEAHVIIDTSRNGHQNMPRDEGCSNWCNLRGAGAGVFPTVDTADTTIVDAYFWLKTPGESDGCTEALPDGRRCTRFDTMCSSDGSIGTRVDEPRAPEAGHWFDYQVKELARNAVFEPVAAAEYLREAQVKGTGAGMVAV